MNYLREFFAWLLFCFFWMAVRPTLAASKLILAGQKRRKGGKVTLSSEENRKYEQKAFGQLVVRNIFKMLLDAKMAEKFGVVSYPDEKIYRLVVFKFDERGESIVSGSKMARGFKRLQVKIQSPAVSVISLFDKLGKQESKLVIYKVENLYKEVEALLLGSVLCDDWIRNDWGRWTRSV